MRQTPLFVPIFLKLGIGRDARRRLLDSAGRSVAVEPPETLDPMPPVISSSFLTGLKNSTRFIDGGAVPVALEASSAFFMRVNAFPPRDEVTDVTAPPQRDRRPVGVAGILGKYDAGWTTDINVGASSDAEGAMGGERRR